MGAPEIIYLSCLGLVSIIASYAYGVKKKYSSVITTILGMLIQIALLSWGGFFK